MIMLKVRNMALKVDNGSFPLEVLKEHSGRDKKIKEFCTVNE